MFVLRILVSISLTVLELGVGNQIVFDIALGNPARSVGCNRSVAQVA